MSDFTISYGNVYIDYAALGQAFQPTSGELYVDGKPIGEWIADAKDDKENEVFDE